MSTPTASGLFLVPSPSRSTDSVAEADGPSGDDLHSVWKCGFGRHVLHSLLKHCALDPGARGHEGVKVVLYTHQWGAPTALSPRARDELLLLSGRGDQAAFAAFYDELAPVIFGIANCAIADADAAGDITVTTFVRLWRQAGHFDASTHSSTAWAVREVLRQILRRAHAPQHRMVS